MDKKLAKEILDCPMLENDINAETVGEYLSGLLITLLEEDEGFNSKRPFGNSGWFYQLKYSLAEGGFVPAELYDDWDPEQDHLYDKFKNVDGKKSEELLTDAIRVYFE
jgi:hypothetical protein